MSSKIGQFTEKTAFVIAKDRSYVSHPALSKLQQINRLIHATIRKLVQKEMHDSGLTNEN